MPVHPAPLSVSTASQPTSSHIAFIDTSIDDYRSIAAAMAAGVEVVLIDGASDGLAQIAAHLAGRSNVEAVHVFSHGSEGRLALGDAAITIDSLAGRADALATIRDALSGDADLLLWGCEVGAGERGQSFLEALAEATGADVAASTDLTGSSVLGGNWALEQRTGAIEAALPFADEAPELAGVLATVSFGNGDVVYGESEAIRQVNDNDGIPVDIRFGVESEADVFLYSYDEGLAAQTLGGVEDGGVALSITADGRSFDLNGFDFFADDDSKGILHDIVITYTRSGSQPETLRFTPQTPNVVLPKRDLGAQLNDVTKVVIESDYYVLFNNFDIEDVKLPGGSTPDETPPVITDVAIPDVPMKIGDIVTVTITVDGDGDTYTLGAGSNIGGHALANLAKLNDATYTATFTVTEGMPDVAAGADIAVDLVLVDSADNASDAYTTPIAQAGDAIDANRPGLATVTLDPADDLGDSSTDNLTSVTRPQLVGKAEAGSTVTLRIDDVEVATGIVVDSNGDWEYTPAGPLGQGPHTIEARATDAAGNAGSFGPTLTITIDTAAPTASVGSASVAVGAAVTTARSTETGTIYLVEAAFAVHGSADLDAALQAGVATRAVVNAANTDTTIATTGLAAGSYVLYAVDGAGNVSVASAGIVSLQATPVAVANSIAFSEDTGTSDADFITRVALQDLSGTLSAPTIAGERVEVWIGGQWITATHTVGSTDWSLDGQTLAGNGSLQVRVSNDVASSAPLAQAYAIDLTAPAASATGVVFSSDSGYSSTDRVTNVAAQDVSGFLSADLAVGDTVWVSPNNGGTWTQAHIDGPRAWSLSGLTLAGSNTFQVKVIDLAGNEGEVEDFDYVLDTGAPTASVGAATIDVGTAVTTARSSETGAVYLVKSTLAIASPADLTAAVLAGDATAAQVTAAATDTTVATTGLDAGDYLLYAVDAAGNVSLAAANSVTLQAPQTPAPVAVVDSIAFSDDTGTSDADFVTRVALQDLSGTLSAPTIAGERVEVWIGGQWITATHTIGSTDWSLDGLTLAGSGTLRVRVTNGATSSAALEQDYVIDTTAPAVGATGIAFSNDSGDSSTDLVTNMAAQDVSGVLSADLEDGDTVWVSANNGGTWIQAHIDGARAWSLSGLTLAGSNTFQVKVIDRAGNEGDVEDFDYVLDTGAPTASVGAATIDVGTTVTTARSSETGAVYLVKSSLAIASLADLRAAVLAGDATTAAVLAAATDTTVATTGLDAGDYLLYAVDAAGNVSLAAANTVTLQAPQTPAPVAVVDSIAFSDDTGTSDADFVTRVALQDLSGTLSAPTIAGERVEVWIGGQWVAAAHTVGSTDWSLDGQTLDGSGTLRVRVTNGATSSAALEQDYVIDTTAPGAPTDIALSDDSGASDDDGVTNVAQQDIAALLAAPLGAGDRLFGSVDGGQHWIDITASVVGRQVQWNDAVLRAGAGEIALKVADLAGNESQLGSLDYRLDTGLPQLQRATVDGRTLVLVFSDASGLDGALVPPAEAFTVTAAGQALAVTAVAVDPVTGAVTLTLASGVTAGQAVTVTYDPGAGIALADAAGNQAAPLGATPVTNDTAAPGTPGTPANPGNGNGNTTVDGVAVTTTTVRNADGTVTQTLSIPVVVSSREEQVGDYTVADIPLVKGPGNTSLLLAQVPTGYGLQVQGLNAPKAAADSLTDLIRAIQARTVAGSADQDQLTGGGGGFLDTLQADTSLLVQTIVPTLGNRAGGAPDEALVLKGNGQGPQTALVIDVNGLADGVHIVLDDIQFAAVVGAGRIDAGAGNQLIWGDGASQTVVLGDGDDTVHAGAGDDLVVVGGGSNFIDGGAGRDVAEVAGRSRADYTLRVQDGKLVMVQADAAAPGVNTLDAIEVLRFADAEADTSQRGTVARLYEALLERAPDAAGIDFWVAAVERGMGLDEVAQYLLDSREAQQSGAHAGNAAYVESLYGAVFGRAADAGGLAHWTGALDAGLLTRAEVALALADSREKLDLSVAPDLDFGASDVGAIVRLYDALYGRRPDEGGLNFWIARSEAGMSLTEIANGFVHAAESDDAYAGLDDAAFIGLLYQTALGRTASDAEMAQWLDMLDQQQVDRGYVLLSVAESTEMIELVGTIGTGIETI